MFNSRIIIAGIIMNVILWTTWLSFEFVESVSGPVPVVMKIPALLFDAVIIGLVWRKLTRPATGTEEVESK